MLLEETKNLIAKDELDERNPDHDIHVITKLFGRRIVFKVEQEGGALVGGGCHGSSGGGGSRGVVRGRSIGGRALLRVCLSH